MNDLMARWFSCGIVAMALLFTGCATASPAPTPKPDPTVAGMETRAPTATVVPELPTPTAFPPVSAPADVPAPAGPENPLAGAGPAARDEGESELLAALAALPLEFAERGIWFSNFKQSLEVAGISRATNFKEFRSLPEDQRKLYVRNFGGRVSSLLSVMRQTLADWEDAYGFSFYEIDAVTVTSDSKPLETHYVTGEFDEEAIVQSLTELDYRTESVGDDVYYAIRDDFEQDLSLTNPATHAALGQANRIFVGDNLLMVSPDTPPVFQVIRARNGEIPTLAESPAFASIAAELSDPPERRPAHPGGRSGPGYRHPPEQIPGGWQRPEEWEVMHEWEAFGAGYSKTPDAAALRYSLYYPHRDWAELDAETLVERIESYMAWLGRVSPGDRFCETWSPSAQVYGNGSTLTVTCGRPTGDESVHLPSGVTSLVPLRLLGFLAP